MSEYERRAYLGKGLAWPLQVNARGEIALANSEQDVQQSILIVLATRPGERVMRPEFGCRAHELLFEPRNAATRTLMQRYVEQSLRRWEPRINVRSVQVGLDTEYEGAWIVQIEYEIKATHDVRSIVYPFFLAGEENW